MKKRKILFGALAICIVAIMTFGSLAYFTAQKTMTNKFYTYKYDPDNPTPPTAEELFSIKIYEQDDTKNDGSVTERGNTYINVLPGDKIGKDPTVENTGMYDAYIRVNVTISNASAWKGIMGADPVSNLFTVDMNKWQLANIKDDVTNDTITYSYYLKEALAGKADKETAGGKATLFTEVVIPASICVDQFVRISSFTVKITADAIQSKGTGTVSEAFVLFDAQD